MDELRNLQAQKKNLIDQGRDWCKHFVVPMVTEMGNTFTPSPINRLGYRNHLQWWKRMTFGNVVVEVAQCKSQTTIAAPGNTRVGDTTYWIQVFVGEHQPCNLTVTDRSNYERDNEIFVPGDWMSAINEAIDQFEFLAAQAKLEEEKEQVRILQKQLLVDVPGYRLSWNSEE